MDAGLSAYGSMMHNYTPDYFDRLQCAAKQSAQRVVPHLLKYVPATSVVDVGCGIGTWLSVVREHGVTDVWGVDGDYIDRNQLQIPQNQFHAQDLNKKWLATRRFDLAMSVEVAEHLRPDSADGLVDVLTSLAPVVAFSAAIPGQGGDCHLNEQWPRYWIEKFASRGFRAVDVLRRPLWDDPEVAFWYAQNLLLFVDQTKQEHYPLLFTDEAQQAALPMSIVHPANLVQATWREMTLKLCLRLRDALPEAAVVFMIDGGELGEMELGNGRRWSRFHDRPSIAWEKPRDARQITDELLAAQAEGIDHLVIAWPAFWWLDHYVGLNFFLERYLRLQRHEPLFRIYAFRQQ